MPAIIIRNDAERRAAIERAQKLLGCPAGSDEELELELLIDAIAEYDIANAIPGSGGRSASGNG
jgi:hypothetical protein